MTDGFSLTPRYVLMHDRNPAGPSVIQSSELETKTVFGFSAKPRFDIFLQQCSLELTPFPLVRGYLQRQLDLCTGVLWLIVLDATSPNELKFEAATAQAIVEAFDLKRDAVEVSHELLLDESSGNYRVHPLEIPLSQKAVR